MATVAQQRQPTSAQTRPHHEASRSVSTSPANMAPAQHNPAPAPAPAKKGKGKKATDPSEQQKQIQAKIAQLELDQAGDKEQELEIGASTYILRQGGGGGGTEWRSPCGIEWKSDALI
jgi:hypothetical protein